MLLEALKAKQQELGMTDVAFAAKLGIPRPTWTNTKLGYKRVGEKVAAAALRAFPELGPEVLLFLRQDVPIGSKNGPKVA